MSFDGVRKVTSTSPLAGIATIFSPFFSPSSLNSTTLSVAGPDERSVALISTGSPSVTIEDEGSAAITATSLTSLGVSLRT